MLTQPLLDKLVQLHLPAFREGLQEQLNNPKYAELAFEERLALLVDLECTRRHDRRIQRLSKLAAFPQSATLEDLDLSASRGLERRFVLELAQCNWIDQHLNTLVLGPTGSGKSFLSCVLGLAACRTESFRALLPHFPPAIPTGPISPGWLFPRPACQPG